MDSKTYGDNDNESSGGECVHSDKRVKKEKKRKTNDITAIIIEYNLFDVLFSSLNVRFALFLPLQCYCCARIVLRSNRFDNSIEIGRREDDADPLGSHTYSTQFRMDRQIDSNPF